MSRSEEREGEGEDSHLNRDGKRSSDTAKKYGKLMARVMLVIRKIVDRRAYNRTNIVNLILALTYRANHFSSLARSSAITSLCPPLPSDRLCLLSQYDETKI